MKYQSKNELKNFEFKEASIVEITYQHQTLALKLDNVTILAANSNNRDIRDMRANDLLLTFENAKITNFVEEGYKVYDADNNLTEAVDDVVVEESQYANLLETLAGAFLYSIEEASNRYIVNVDGEMQTYRIELECSQNRVEWDRFLNKEV